MGYQLARDVHVARVGGDLVFLDARENAYFCLGSTPARRLQKVLRRGVPATIEEATLLRDLADEGILEAAAEALPLAACSRRLPRRELPAAQAPLPSASLCDVLTLAAAGAMTVVTLMLVKPLLWLRVGAPVERSGRSVEEVVRLASTFNRLRPFFPGTGRCLPRSLFLLLFLRLRGYRADWVFGVRTHPFLAHCWVEADGTVLDDTIEHVAWFTPIAAF